jgi:glycine cleavage system aminomethyltransferase T
LNRTQATVWQLTEEALQMPEESAFTDITDATVFLALIGATIFSITEQLTALDLSDPSRTRPFLLQGPFAHVPCQIVVVAGTGGAHGILLTCSRGYALDMVSAIMDAGARHHLRPAGAAAFQSWLKSLAV